MIVVEVIFGGILALFVWYARWRRDAWRGSSLYEDTGDWQLKDVRWRRLGGRIEVTYSVVNQLPGQTQYSNDFIRVFQRGIGLEEREGRASRVLLKGAETRFMQVFDARDGSTPVIQSDSLNTQREESDE